ncbi:MAG: hypothetical protein CL535_05510 [Ahrensia sp.]|nr:hypothetical protein [Ahrensia sp.]|tara:strand:- start:31751 stop:32146 length:396 start_codon:yes stop_codon:yes gene_type:complete
MPEIDRAKKSAPRKNRQRPIAPSRKIVMRKIRTAKNRFGKKSVSSKKSASRKIGLPDNPPSDQKEIESAAAMKNQFREKSPAARKSPSWKKPPGDEKRHRECKTAGPLNRPTAPKKQACGKVAPGARPSSS